jgi:hypothetical protein
LALCLDNGAPALNASPDGERPVRKEARCTAEETWEAADVLIRVWIERIEPLAGTAAVEGAEPLHFDGWLELLRVISEPVATASR